ncbi:hypothetical protein [Providencia rettgeri]|uniref:hypothetical protein n=1 Tax=Providencia rettgeri TaxID=587 RepID=UPI003018FBB7
MSTNSMTQSKFIITTEPVCFVKPYQPVSETISISRRGDRQHTTPLYIALSDEDIQLSDDYLRELQAQGVDKLADSLQDSLAALNECHYTGAVTQTIQDEINRCRAFAERLRHPIVSACLCDSCNDWMRGGCSSTCAAYGTRTLQNPMLPIIKSRILGKNGVSL